MLRILRRTQHMLDPRAYLAESQIPLARNPQEVPQEETTRETGALRTGVQRRAALRSGR